MDKIKILCLVVLGFLLGVYSGKAIAFDENGVFLSCKEHIL